MPIDKLEGNKTEIFPPVRVRPIKHFINTLLQQDIALSHDVTSGSDKMPCIKLDKPLVVSIFRTLCLFDLILYDQVNNLSVTSGQVFLG